MRMGGGGNGKLVKARGGGRCRRGTAVAGLAAPGGAGAAVAGARGGGCVGASRGTGSSVLLAGVGGRGHGTTLAAWGRPAEREWRSRGLGMEDTYGRRGEREAQWGA